MFAVCKSSIMKPHPAKLKVCLTSRSTIAHHLPFYLFQVRLVRLSYSLLNAFNQHMGLYMSFSLDIISYSIPRWSIAVSYLQHISPPLLFSIPFLLLNKTPVFPGVKSTIHSDPSITFLFIWDAYIIFSRRRCICHVVWCVFASQSLEEFYKLSAHLKGFVALSYLYHLPIKRASSTEFFKTYM